MMGLFNFLRSEASARLVTALLHSLWQAAGLALLLWLVLQFLPAKSVRARYLLSLLFLIALPVAMAVTWSALSVPERRASTPAETVLPLATAGLQSAAPGRLATGPAAPAVPRGAAHDWTAVAAALWLAGVSLMLIRATVSVAGAQRLRRRCAPLDDPAVSSLLADLCRKMGLQRRVRVLVGAVPGPAAIGLLWPAVLVPIDLLTGMPAGQMGLILAHELAHIRHYDYLVNLLQLILEALLFFNPAVYWTNRQIRKEREAACDALAVSVTGSPREYAQILVDYAARVRTRALPAFHGRDEAPMSERLRRILLGTYHPCSRLPILTLAGGLGVGLLCLGLLCAGTSLAVAQALTPQQRMQKLDQAQKDYGQALSRTPEESDKVKVHIAGVVRIEDEPPPPEMWGARRGLVTIYSKSGISSYGQNVGFYDGTFQGSVPPGAISVLVTADGYAPAMVGPRILKVGESWDDVSVVLRRGFEGRVRLTDEKGIPVVGAKVYARYVVGGVSSGQREEESDVAGLVSLAHVSAEVPVELRMLAAGYQHLTIEHKMQQQEVLTVKLQPAAASEGVVTDRDTGQPVPGAEVFVINSNGPFQYPLWGSPWYTRPEAVATLADGQGRFKLTSLRDDTKYVLFVRADYHAPAFLYDVHAGRNDLKAALGQPLYVKGRVIGSLDALPQDRGRPRISYAEPYHITPDSTNESWNGTPLDVLDDGGHFEINGLWEGTVHISAGPRRVDVPLTKAVDDLVIDLNPPAKGQDAATQPVVIRLLAPEGAEPTGTVQLVVSPPEPGTTGDNRLLRLENGQVRLDVPVQSRLLLMPGSLVGYWFEQHTKSCPATVKGESVWEVPVEPAGALIGQVLGADGQPVPDASVTPVRVRYPSGGFRLLPPPSAQIGADGRFMFTPVQYGVTYVIVASRTGQFVASGQVTVDGTAPLREVALKFPAGVSVRGRVLLPDGKPAEFAPVRLEYSTPWDHSFGTGDFRTDHSGSFEIRGVNPDAPGRYYVSIAPLRLYRQLSTEIKPNAQGLILQLERGETLKGSVIDRETGQPAPGVQVYALAMAAPYGAVDADAPTNERGEFECTRLAPVRYSLHVRQAQDVGEVTAQGGQTAAVTIQIRKSK